MHSSVDFVHRLRVVGTREEVQMTAPTLVKLAVHYIGMGYLQIKICYVSGGLLLYCITFFLNYFVNLPKLSEINIQN